MIAHVAISPDQRAGALVAGLVNREAAKLQHAVPFTHDQHIGACDPELRLTREPVADGLSRLEVAVADRVLESQGEPMGRLVHGIDVDYPALLRIIDGIAHGAELCCRGLVIPARPRPGRYDPRRP